MRMKVWPFTVLMITEKEKVIERESISTNLYVRRTMNKSQYFFKRAGVRYKAVTDVPACHHCYVGEKREGRPTCMEIQLDYSFAASNG